MANNIATTLQRDGIMNGAMMALREAIPALSLFATTFEANPLLRGSNKVVVEYHPLDTQPSKDFTYANGYVFDQDTNTASREVTINKRKYKDLSFTSEELMRQPHLNVEKKGMRAGQKLIEDVFADILGIVTAANYPALYGPVAAGAFFPDDLQDIDTIADELKWPRSGRSMMINHAYEGNLLKDAVFYKERYGENNAISESRLPRLRGFDIGTTAYIPDNGENLQGMAIYESAILLGFAPIKPAADGDTITYETLSDPDGSGLTIEFREWFDRKFDTMRRTIELNYGTGTGEEDAIIRIPSQ